MTQGTAPSIPRSTIATSHDGGAPTGPDPRRLAIVLAVAFVVGALLARWLDWRTHAHPRD